MFERDSTDVGDQRINKGKGKVAGKNMLEPSDSENEKQSSSPHKPKVYVVSENSNNVVKVQKSNVKTVQGQGQNAMRNNREIIEEYPQQRTEGTEEVMIIEESEEEVTLDNEDDLPFQPDFGGGSHKRNRMMSPEDGETLKQAMQKGSKMGFP